jgi:hypothetical protein
VVESLTPRLIFADFGCGKAIITMHRRRSIDLGQKLRFCGYLCNAIETDLIAQRQMAQIGIGVWRNQVTVKTGLIMIA